MASKTITITEDVYKMLKRQKKKEESFSDLLRRLSILGNGDSLSNFFGEWEMDDEEYEKIKKNLSQSIDQSLKLERVKFD